MNICFLLFPKFLILKSRVSHILFYSFLGDFYFIFNYLLDLGSHPVVFRLCFRLVPQESLLSGLLRHIALGYNPSQSHTTQVNLTQSYPLPSILSLRPKWVALFLDFCYIYCLEWVHKVCCLGIVLGLLLAI